MLMIDWVYIADGTEYMLWVPYIRHAIIDDSFTADAATYNF